MLKSLLKYVWKGFEIVLRHYVIFKTLNFMNMNSPGSFHQPVMLWVTLANFLLDLSRTGQIWLSTRVEKRCFIKQVKVSEWHILWFVFIHN